MSDAEREFYTDSSTTLFGDRDTFRVCESKAVLLLGSIEYQDILCDESPAVANSTTWDNAISSLTRFAPSGSCDNIGIQKSVAPETGRTSVPTSSYFFQYISRPWLLRDDSGDLETFVRKQPTPEGLRAGGTIVLVFDSIVQVFIDPTAKLNR